MRRAPRTSHAPSKQNSGSDITIEFRTSPALLGGLRVKLGSDVWDGSVNSRLAAFSQQL
jgi:F-type H+-transporting ATPase subunit delta